MAQLNGPLCSLAASGTLGHALVYRRRGQIQNAHKLYKPKNPKTAKQIRAREIFGIGVNLAKSLTPAQKAAYQAQARAYNNNPANNVFLTIFLTAVKYSYKYSKGKYSRMKYGNPNNFL